MPDGAIKLGSDLYLFKSSTNGSDCIVSAHGGYLSENRTFTVPGKVELRFYSSHGASVIDPSISEFFRKFNQAEPVEVVAGGTKCKNYLLSKYQGEKHNKMGETYDLVKNNVKTIDLKRTKDFQGLMRSGNTSNPNQSDQLRYMEQLINAPGASVLTIRNRWNVLMGVPLKDAVNAVVKAIPTLKVIHCLFCRSYMLPDKVGAVLGATVMPDEQVNYRQP